MKRLLLLLSAMMLMLAATVDTAAQTQRKKTAARQTTRTTQARKTVAKPATTRKPATTKRKTSTTKAKTTTKSRRSTPSTSQSIASLKNRRDQLQKQLAKNETELRTTNKKVKSELTDLAVLTGKIDRQKKVINEIQLQVDSLNRNISDLTRRYNQLSRQLDDRRQKYQRSLLYLYKHKDADNRLLFILSAPDFQQMVRRYRYVREYSNYQQTQGQLIQRKQQQVNETKAELEQTQRNKSNSLSQQQRENEILVKQQDERQAKVKKLQRQQRDIQNVIASGKREMAELNKKIDYYVQLAIEQERKRREAEERERQRQMAAASSAKGKGDKTPPAAGSTPSPANSAPAAAPMPNYRASGKEYELSSNFTSNKGRLPMPITGRYVISARYGSYSLDGIRGVTLNNKGINITGPAGAQARCIFQGEVSAVFSLGGLYNVLVRHGSYISVYCNLSSASVRQGQKVGARAILGNIARDASGRCTLHFQLRKETATLNPLSWLAQ